LAVPLRLAQQFHSGEMPKLRHREAAMKKSALSGF